MTRILARIAAAVRHRPVRVAEAALALAAAVGIGLTDTAEAQIIAIVTALVGLVGAEAAQTRTIPVARDPNVDHRVPKAQRLDVDAGPDAVADPAAARRGRDTDTP